MAQDAQITNDKALGTEPPVISEKEVLKHLRRRRPARHKVPLKGLTIGERVADLVAAVAGSWTFIIAQTVVLALWIVVNAYNGKAWDPYPFILLNLLLSFQAAYTAPIIMMSQNRQETRDRMRAENDYQVNLKAEIEIRVLTEKMDQLLHHQWQRLLEIQRLQTEMIEDLANRTASPK